VAALFQSLRFYFGSILPEMPSFDAGQRSRGMNWANIANITDIAIEEAGFINHRENQSP